MKTTRRLFVGRSAAAGFFIAAGKVYGQSVERDEQRPRVFKAWTSSPVTVALPLYTTVDFHFGPTPVCPAQILSGTELAFDPKTGRFDNDKANAMLAPPERKGFECIV